MSDRAKRKIFFLFHGRFPSEKAAALFLHEEAHSFAALGHNVTIIAPFRFGRTSPFLQNTYRLVYVPTIDLVPLFVLQSIMFRVSMLVYSWSAFVYLLLHARRTDLIISTEAFPLLVASYWFRNTLFELHDYPERNLSLFRRLFKRTRHILVTNEWKLVRFRKDFPRDATRAFLEQNAVDVATFSVDVSRDDARTRLSLPSDTRMAVYTGHLYAWKGVDTLAEAALLVPDVHVYVVGGTRADCVAYAERWKHVQNLHVVGLRPHEEIPFWLRAADVLVLPNSAKENISTFYTSPMKLFEYLASGRPVVASDIPSIREITSDDRAILVSPDDPPALASGVLDAISRPDDRSEKARQWVHEHTWLKRAARILAAVNN